jgi:hypothetical protein
MVAAGVGANVGITLYVIGEGRYEPENFPVEKIDYARLTWDRARGRSNYEELSQEAMATHDGTSWIVEAAGRASLTDSGYYAGRAYTANPGLFDAYIGLCRNPGAGTGTAMQPCTGQNALSADAGRDATPAEDAGARDADAPDADSGHDAAGDVGAPPVVPPEPPPAGRCEGYDDLDVATSSTHTYDVWVTRLRALLPAGALARGDLLLHATATQAPESNVHYATSYADDTNTKQTRKSCAGAPLRHEPFTPIVFGAAAALGALAFARRRRR